MCVAFCNVTQMLCALTYLTHQSTENKPSSPNEHTFRIAQLPACSVGLIRTMFILIIRMNGTPSETHQTF